MTSGILVSLAITWLSIGPPSFSSEYAPSVKAHGIAEAAWGNRETPDLPTIDRVFSRCAHPIVVLVPPRPNDPLQASFVSRLATDLKPVGIEVVDGERLQSDQERDADLVYTQTSDAAAASRVLLAQRGDFEVSWRLEVAIEGPKDLYGIETWEARGEVRLTFVNLLTGDELDGVEVVATARQRTREEALDRSIKMVTADVAARISGPILRDWYGFAVGSGTVLVDVTGSGDSLNELIVELQQLEGVNTVTPVTPDEPPRLLVRGWRTAQELAEQLGTGNPMTCHHLELSGGRASRWIVIPLVVGVLVIICLLVARRRPPPPLDLETA